MDQRDRPRPFGSPKRGATWPPAPEATYWFQEEEHHIGIEVARSSDGSPVIVGISLRRTTPLEIPPRMPDSDPSTEELSAHLDYKSRQQKAEDGLLFDTDPRPLSSRDVRRMALDRYVRAARDIAGAIDASHREWRETGDPQPWPGHEVRKAYRRVKLPPGRPSRDVGFYRGILQAWRELSARPEIVSVAAEIARMKGEELGEDFDVNTVYQWKHRALELERLGRFRAPTTKRGKE